MSATGSGNGNRWSVGSGKMEDIPSLNTNTTVHSTAITNSIFAIVLTIIL